MTAVADPSEGVDLEKMTWDELETRAEDVARLSPTYLLLMVNLLGLLATQVFAFTAAKHLPWLRQPHARGRIA